MSEVHYKEIWSISEHRILKFFESNYAVEFQKIERLNDIHETEGLRKIHETGGFSASHEFQNLYCYIGSVGDVNVQIDVLPPNMIMKVPMPRCSVSITGPESEAEEVHRKFVMNFLSAGG